MRRDQLLAEKARLKQEEQRQLAAAQYIDFVAYGQLPAKLQQVIARLEFVRWLLALDKIIAKYDRSNDFNLALAMTDLTYAMNELRDSATDFRDVVAIAERSYPNFAKTLLKDEAKHVSMSYIRWRKALDM